MFKKDRMSFGLISREKSSKNTAQLIIEYPVYLHFYFCNYKSSPTEPVPSAYRSEQDCNMGIPDTLGEFNQGHLIYIKDEAAAYYYASKSTYFVLKRFFRRICW